MALTEKLTNIANGFRASRGTTDKYTLDEMAVLAAEPTGGGDLPEEAFTITGNCFYRFANKGWDWFIEKYGDSVVTREITNISNMFDASAVEEIPFVLNVNNINVLRECFKSTSQLNKCPKIRGTINWSTSTDLYGMVTSCVSVRDFGDLFTDEMLNGFSEVKVTSQYSVPKCVTFGYCYSLRTVPSWWYQFRLNEESTAFPNTTYTLYNNCFQYCYSLDEAKNIPVWRCSTPQTSNMFSNAVAFCRRLKQFTFERDENSLPIVVEWKGQTIDFTNFVGYTGSGYQNLIVDYNSGITTDKFVSGANEYSALKDDPDWYTYDIAYSRYNHDSAVNTINSLPDTSAYLATAGGTNTIKFKGTAGSNTDGGAINTLTEEEIAVATAKGWTVTFA